jgi:hypothetical protein
MTDPDSRRYCICNDIAYRKMIGCDNNKVSIIIRVIKKYIYYDNMCICIIYIFGFSAFMNGFILNVLVLSLNQVENGFVQYALINLIKKL